MLLAGPFACSAFFLIISRGVLGAVVAEVGGGAEPTAVDTRPPSRTGQDYTGRAPMHRQKK